MTTWIFFRTGGSCGANICTEETESYRFLSFEETVSTVLVFCCLLDTYEVGAGDAFGGLRVVEVLVFLVDRGLEEVSVGRLAVLVQEAGLEDGRSLGGFWTV